MQKTLSFCEQYPLTTSFSVCTKCFFYRNFYTGAAKIVTGITKSLKIYISRKISETSKQKYYSVILNKLIDLYPLFIKNIGISSKFFLTKNFLVPSIFHENRFIIDFKGKRGLVHTSFAMNSSLKNKNRESSIPSKIYLFYVNNKNTRKSVKYVFIVNFEHISHLSLKFLFLTLNK